jgi:Matrixin/Domain of unknown function (DUF4214)
MRRLAAITSLFAVVLGTLAPVAWASASNLEYTDSAAPRQIRWPSNTINIAFSNALKSPGTGIKLGTDVTAALRRALKRWSNVADINFVITDSAVQSVSPGNKGDGLSLVTIADTPENNSLFAGGAMTGRTRIFYDQDTGAIAEADVVINPHPVSAEGVPVQFSTDGTSGTYDLESTFTHEIGHLLGLEHSSIASSTMNERQALNGLYGAKAFTERTLSDEDRAQLTRIYGSGVNVGAIEGRVLKQSLSTQPTLNGVHVWAEESKTGRLVTSDVSNAGGEFRLENLRPNTYRLFTAHGALTVSKANEQQKTATSEVKVDQDTTEDLNLIVPSQQVSSRFLNPRLVGTNGELSMTPVFAEPGKKLNLLVGGEGLDQVAANGVTITSPFFAVQQETLRVEPFGTSFPVISFTVSVAPNTPFGDYTIRLQSNSGHVIYVPGAITVDPGVESDFASAADDPRFFIKQHYRDFLGRDADTEGLEYWSNQLEQCGEDLSCQRTRRISVAAAFFGEAEFQRKNLFVYQLYRVALGRRPLFAEFSADREALSSNDRESRQALSEELVERPEFISRYPLTLTPKQFIEALLSGLWQKTQVDLSSDSANLVELLGPSQSGRAAVILRLAENAAVAKAEHDGAVVLMQYFGYLLRDPSDEDYKSWLDNVSRSNEQGVVRYNRMICSFLSSSEYQARFGMVMTHSPNECR